MSVRTRLAKSFVERSGALLVTVGILFFSASPPAGAAPESLEDTDIAAAVTDELIADPGVQGFRIDVEVDEGIVTLSGDVNNILAKERAARIARAVRGVRSVVNTVDVDTPEVGNRRLRRQVKTALATDPATESWEIRAEASDGTVTLRGTVESWAEKRLAGRVAKGVRGVRRLVNEIQVDFASERSDEQIAADVRQRFRWDAHLDDALIEVNVEDGEVDLGGVVGSAAECDRARRKAWAAGVSSVDAEDLEVEPWAEDERLRGDKWAARPEQKVEEAVQDALLYSPRANAFEIGVEADDGIVTLTGVVDNVEAKRSAARIARNTVGVWRVESRLKVRSDEMGDQELERRVEKALLRDPYVDRHEISVAAVNGEAHLYGTVDTSFEKAQADNVAASIRGVEEVSNHLDVTDVSGLEYDPWVEDHWSAEDFDWYARPEDSRTTKKSDWEILEDVKDELFWSPFVDSEDVTVSVEDGTATLRGTADTMQERRAASENALEGGAVAVKNELTVRHGPEYYGS